MLVATLKIVIGKQKWEHFVLRGYFCVKNVFSMAFGTKNIQNKTNKQTKKKIKASLM